MYFPLTVLGFFVVLHVAYRIFHMVYNVIYPYYIARPLKLKKVAGGEWAVVTGSTDGIGRGYALELARSGFAIVLISRSQAKLDQVKSEIEYETRSKVKTIVYDFTEPNVEKLRKNVLTVLKDLEVGILVNNVGASFHHPDTFHKLPGGLQQMADIMFVNMLSATLLTAGLLPQMIKRNSGIIVNIASATSFKQMGASSVYSATKRYVTWLTRILQREYRKTNIIIQLLYPMIVSTKMTSLITKSHQSVFNVTVDQFVHSAIRTIGIVNETTGCPLHQIEMELIKCLPDFVVDAYFGAVIARVHDTVMADQAQNDRQSKDYGYGQGAVPGTEWIRRQVSGKMSVLGYNSIAMNRRPPI